MEQNRKSTRSRRLGAWLGRACRSYLSRERRLSMRLSESGVPIWLTKTCCWIIKLGVLGLFLYTAFWIALISCVITFVAWWILKADFDPYEEQPKWRNGLSGYGLYRGGVRIDPGSPDD